MRHHRRLPIKATLSAATAAFALCSCTSIGQYNNARFNERLAPAPAEAKLAAAGRAGFVLPATNEAAPELRTTFRIRGDRGNPEVLVFLALSGGGSRAAYLSAASMHALEELGLLQEVDAIAAVSGGSLAAAYYVASRDSALDDAALAKALRERGAALPAALKVTGTTVRCTQALSTAEEEALAPALGAAELTRVRELCRAPEFPRWTPEASLATMKKNFIFRYFFDLAWPPNFARYWFSSFDRSDIMVATLASNALFRRAPGALVKSELRIADLNPLRPHLLVHATSATRQEHPNGRDDPFPFGSAFTFTHEDFSERLHSEVSSFSLARAVMASSAFPLAFATMTLEDYTDQPPRRPGEPGPENKERRFLHLIDGGNSDNLGLRSVKRALVQLQASGELERYKRIVVLQVDAFTTPSGTGRHKPDPRGVLDLILDTNVSAAVDSLLQANRDRMLAEFVSGELPFDRECAASKSAIRHFPAKVCQEAARGGEHKLDLKDKLVFFHFGFADVVGAAGDTRGPELRKLLDLIGTSFSIDDAAERLQSSFAEDGYERVQQEAPTALVEEAVKRVLHRDQACMRELIALVRGPDGPEVRERVAMAQRQCRASDRLG
jgi:predicted acylesterase/phospholipase RssA